MACLPHIQMLSWLPCWLKSRFDFLAPDEFWDNQEIPPSMIFPDGKEDHGTTDDESSLLDDGIIQLPSLAHLPRSNASAIFAEKDNSIPGRKTLTKGETPIPLDVALLTTIESFRQFLGLWYNHHSIEKPDLLFQVDYIGGSSGIVRCGSWIPGEPESVHHHFILHMKICKAKEMVNWESLGDWRSVRKEEMLRIYIDYSTTKGSSVLLPLNRG